MKIKRVIINNFKCFKNLNIELNDFSIVVGDNGTGKSTFLEAIHLALTGYYRGKLIIGNISQDIFNKESVDKYLEKVNSNEKIELPEISIEVFFDDCPIMRGDFNSTKSSADGFKFLIQYDERNADSYKELLNGKILSTLPFEFYKCEWITFARKYYTNSKSIDFKSAYLETKVERYGEFFVSKIIRNYIDDTNKINLNQKYRDLANELKNDESLNKINEKINENKYLQQKNVSIGIANSSQNVWEEIITLNKDDIPYSNIGTGNQCIVNTVLSFENEIFKNKGIILIEEPENHLSGMNLNILLNYIKENVKDHQVIITTHSSYVLNKLGMKNLLMFSSNNSIKFENLSDDTEHYFEKLSGFDTLRFILCKKAFLVEGDSDDLIIQRAYLDKFDKLPIEDGFEIIKTGLAYNRFLQLAKELKIRTVLVTDNDGNIDKIETLRREYLNCDWIKVYSGNKDYSHEECNFSVEKIPNVNTLEPELFRANNLEILNEIFSKNFSKDEDLVRYMIKNKTEVAWKIFKSPKKIKYPQYINEAIINE